MIDRVIEAALNQRFLVLLFGAGVALFGVYSALRLNVDAFPDVTNI